MTVRFLPARSQRVVAAAAAALALGALFTMSAAQTPPERTTDRPPLFSDVTTQLGLGFTHTGPGVGDKFQGTGAAWFDYDRDGDLDIYVTRRIGGNVLFRNDGTTFTDVTTSLGVTDNQRDGAGVSIADYDNDGWPDMFLANSDGDALLRNNGGTWFTHETVAAGLDITGDARGTTAAWGDFDGDGWLDLYLTHHVHVSQVEGAEKDWLFRNNGDGTFTDVSAYLAADDLGGYGFIGAWTDVDDDGDLDIFLVNDCPVGPQPIRLFRNDGPDHGNGGWQFSEVSALWGCDRCDAGMGVAVGDYDRDGRLDYLYTNIGTPILLNNDGEGFQLRSGAAGLNVGFIPSTSKTRWTWGANFIDYDLDGWVDLYLASGAFRSVSTIDPQANLLMHNNGDGTFTDLTAESGAGDIDRSRTSVFGDFDNDGDPDLYVVNYEEPARLYRNDNVSGNHFLIVELEGVVSNRDGVGARLRLQTPDGMLQYYETRSGSSLGGGDDRAAYFGLGQAAVAAELLIRWPSGVVQILGDVAGDRRIRVVEDPGARAPDLVTFEAEQSPGGTVLRWQMSYESGVEAFEVQRAGDGSFATIETVTAAGTTLRPTQYSHDLGELPSGQHTFRLRKVHTDGRSDFSPSVLLDVAGARPPSPLSLSRPHPNPFDFATTVDVFVESEQRVNVSLYDVKGRRLAVLFDGVVTPGSAPKISVNGAGFPAGVYLIRASAGTHVAEEKIVLVR